MTQETFQVGHINCQGCERTIRTLLDEIDGVEQVEADRRTNIVVVKFEEAQISRDAVVRELTGIGYAPKRG